MGQTRRVPLELGKDLFCHMARRIHIIMQYAAGELRRNRPPLSSVPDFAPQPTRVEHVWTGERKRVGVYFLLVITLSCLCYYYARFLEPMRDEMLRHFVNFDEAKLCEDEQEMLIHKTLINEVSAKYPPYEKIHPLAYCALSGTIGAQSVLMSKAVVTLIATSIGGKPQFGNVLVYVFLLAMISTILVQTHFLATALKYFDGACRDVRVAASVCFSHGGLRLEKNGFDFF